jgi:hypothetical protein
VLPKHFCLEIFAGTARITSALLRRGLRAFPIDICLHQSHNLLDVHVEHRIIHLLESGRVQFLWLGMPCTSFSVARKNDGVGPGPLRDDDNLFGFKSLTGKNLQKVQDGNNLLRLSLRLLAVCEQHGIPYALENPMSSFAWKMPNMKKFIAQFRPQLIHLDYCCFGEMWKKPTTLMGNFWNMATLALRCRSSSNICSNTLQPHVRLTGVDDNGVFMTLKAQPYPLEFCKAVANLITMAN